VLVKQESRIISPELTVQRIGKCAQTKNLVYDTHGHAVPAGYQQPESCQLYFFAIYASALKMPVC